MHGSSRRRLASIMGAVLLTLALLPTGALAVTPNPPVTPVAPTITSANHATFTVGVAGSFTVTTSGFPAATTSITAGSLPGSVGLVDNGNGTATISGTPVAGDVASSPYSITLTATNGTAPDATQTFTLTILPDVAPAFTSANHATFTVGVAGSFTVTTTGTPTATISMTGGSKPASVTIVDNGNGTATISGTPVAGDVASSPYSITLTATNLAGSPTQTFTLTVNTGGYHLYFLTQPGGGAAGVAWSQQPVVEVLNSLNQVVTSDSSTYINLTISTNPAGGVLTCTGSGTYLRVVNGVATFSGCYISVASSSYYTLGAASFPTWTPATSSAFYVGGSESLVFLTQPGGGATGAVWTQQPVVEIVNSLNQVVTTDNSTIVYLSIATNPVGGTLSCTGGTSEVAVNGYAYFSGCSINVGSSSYYTLSATSTPSWTAATSSAFYIGAANESLLFITQPGGGAAGAVWTQQPVVEVVNSLNQVVTTDNSTVVYLTTGTNPAGGTLSCTSGTSRTVVNGYATFYGCSINIGSASYYTLSATSSPSWTAATSSAFYVTGASSTAVTLAASSALGASSTSGFSTPTKIVKVGQSITIRVTSSPQLAGKTLGVWIAIKGSNGVWAAYKPHASVTMDSTGTAYYTYKFGSKAWLAFRLYYGGGTYAPAWSYPSQFGRAM